MRRIAAFFLAALFAVLFASCAEKTAETDVKTTETTEITNTEEPMNNNSEKITARIEVEDFGVIELELYPDIAPQTVRNFCYLARQGFYDGTIFHRVIKDFMIQGGDPTGTGSGGPGWCIKGEFTANGFQNDLKHERGVISMARLSNPMDSAGCQFFIVHKTSPHLDGQYAAFGRVISGMEVVDRIASETVGYGNRPVQDVVIKSITIEGPELPEPEKLPNVR